MTTLSEPLKALLDGTGEPLAPHASTADYQDALNPFPDAIPLFDLLRIKNGWFAFDRALHLFPLGKMVSGYALLPWNEPALWKHAYSGQVQSCLFFAEDIFGVQFGFHQKEIVRFDPESGTLERFAATLDEWAQRILEDSAVETGEPLAREWQAVHRSLQPTERLLPKQLFSFGGEYATSNLYAMDAARGMQLRGDIYQQIKDLPNGTHIKLVVR
jgi:hypothetical protein